MKTFPFFMNRRFERYVMIHFSSGHKYIFLKSLSAIFIKYNAFQSPGFISSIQLFQLLLGFFNNLFLERNKSYLLTLNAEYSGINRLVLFLFLFFFINELRFLVNFLLLIVRIIDISPK